MKYFWMSVGLIIEIFILRNISEVSAFAFLEIELKKKLQVPIFLLEEHSVVY